MRFSPNGYPLCVAVLLSHLAEQFSEGRAAARVPRGGWPPQGRPAGSPHGSTARSNPPGAVRWTPRLGFAIHSHAANISVTSASAAASVRYTTAGCNPGGRLSGKVRRPGKVSSTPGFTVPSRGCRFFRQSAWRQLLSRRRYAARWRASSLSHCRHCASVAAEFSASSRTSQAAACPCVSEASAVLFKAKDSNDFAL
jgi:hypothetical protein